MPYTEKMINENKAHSNEIEKINNRKKKLQEFSKDEIINMFISLESDYFFLREANTEISRLLGIYKEGYFRYRDYLRRVAEHIKTLNLQKHFETCSIILNPNDKPMLPLYDTLALPEDRNKIKQER